MKSVQAKDLCKFKSITQPFSNGKLMFFVETYIDAKTNQYLTEINSINNQGYVKTWAKGGQNTNPVISHRFLYFIHFDNEQNSEIMQMPLTGGAAEPIFSRGIISELKASKNHIYFKDVQNQDEPKFKTTRFPKVRRVYHLINRQDGYGWLSNHATYSIFTLNNKSKQAKEVFSSHSNFDFQSVDDEHHRLIYLQSINHHRDTQISPVVGAFLYNIKNRKSTLINASLPRGAFNNAQFSPNGKKIALIGNNNYYPGATVNDFYIYDVNSKQLSNLTHNNDAVDDGLGLLSTDIIQNPSNLEVHFLNDDICVFHACHHGHSQLYVCSQNKIKLINDSKRFIFDFNVINQHQLILSSSSTTSPCTVNLLDITNGQERVIYNPNKIYDDTHKYAKAKTFSYQSIDKSTLIHGFFMKSTKAHKNSPVILYVHGGPHGAFGYSFMHRFQSLAANGYSLVYINPRGSTGYGQSFEDCVAGHYGEKDYQDLLQGLSVALHKFKGLDNKELFIMGGSYGGFMTLWAIGHTNRFKGAIAQRPVSDWALLYGTSDMGMSCKYDMGEDLYKNYALAKYWNESPIAYARNVQTPLLLQHGEYDMRCPISQSEAYFTAVKQVEKDVTYYRYPQSFHGISRNGLPSLRVQRIKDVISWLNHHK